MLVDLHAEALAEAGGAAVWYDEQVPGLGHEFTDALERGLATIAERPDAWPVSAQGTASGSTLRVCNLTRFPFSVVDLRKPERIFIVAVAHQRRRPTYWVDRLGS